MSKKTDGKINVWKNIFRLALPYKKQFAWVVILSLMGTTANLVEPLIYREAINDVAGLFVREERDKVQQEMLEQEDESFIFPRLNDSSSRELHTSKMKKQPAPKAKKKIKQPHTRTHVASRSPEQALETLLWAVALLFLVNISGTIIWLIGENKNVKFSCLVEQHFIQGTFAHVLRLPLGFFNRKASAALAKQIDQSEEVSSVVNGFSQQIFPELISLTGIVAIMFWQNITLTAVALAVIPVYLIIAWRSARKLETGLSGYYEKWEQVSAGIQDALSGIKTVKLSGAEGREVERFEKISSAAYGDYIKRSKLANRYVFWETALTHLSTALVLGYGGYLTLENKLTPGDVVMFVAYLDRLYGPIDSLASLWVNLQQNVASVARAYRLLGSAEEEMKGPVLAIAKGRIEFRNVNFSYTRKKKVLTDVSFTIDPGKITALVGSSGAGKTTAVDLLMKLYEPASGEILIDGKNISGMDPASIRQQVGMVATDGAVFAGTLADNIRYKRPEASDEEVMQAALSAGMHSTMERLQDGVDTLVGENGIGLSVGERQRLQIARMLAAMPQIMILDEATANLDFATEAEIRKTIEKIRSSHTILIIAHRYSMVRDADYVIVLDKGEVLEQGTPSALMEKKGWFSSFAKSAEKQ